MPCDARGAGSQSRGALGRLRLAEGGLSATADRLGELGALLTSAPRPPRPAAPRRARRPARAHPRARLRQPSPRSPSSPPAMARTVALAVRSLALLALLASASAWTGSTLTVPGLAAAGRSPVLVFTPNVRTSAKLPVVLLLHGRCQNALGADAYFHFANLVDQARAHAPAPCTPCTRSAALESASQPLLTSLARPPSAERLCAGGARGHAQPDQLRRLPEHAAGRHRLPPVGCHARVLRVAPRRRRCQLERRGRLRVPDERACGGQGAALGGRAARLHRRLRDGVRRRAARAAAAAWCGRVRSRLTACTPPRQWLHGAPHGVRPPRDVRRRGA